MAVAAKKWGEVDKLSDPEWIMLYGETRVGKSFQTLDMAQTMVENNPETQVYIFNTDHSLKRDLRNFPFLLDMDCVQCRYCPTFKEAANNLVDLVKAKIVVPGRDLIIVDRATLLWNTCPEFYVEKTLKTSIEELEFAYQTQDQGKVKGGSAIVNYYTSGINPMWARWEYTVRVHLGAHVIFVCNETEIAEETTKIRIKDSNQVVKAYQAVGVKPKIQKDTPFLFHTQLYLSQPYAKRFYVMTAGERGDRNWIVPRQELKVDHQGERMCLGRVYLENIAGFGKED